MQKTVWILADDRAGNVNQLLGIAEALGLPYERKNISYTKWVKWPNIIRGASLIGIASGSSAALKAPWPDVVLSAGRRSFPVARWIKRQSKGHTKIVQLMNPGWAGFKEADLVVLPVHDQYKGRADNVFQVSGTPHNVTPAKLATEKAYWAKVFENYKAPRLSLIVGGATKNKPFTIRMAKQLVQQVLALNPGSVLVTTSRRTPLDVIGVLQEGLPQGSYIYKYGDGGDNPYFGLLAWADMIVVTGDSMSMCSECCGTTAPVYIFAPDEMMGEKHKRFHAELYRQGCASALGGQNTFAIKGGSFNPARAVADQIDILLSDPS